MNGPGILRERTTRNTAETTTIATSQSPADTRGRCSATKLDLGEAASDLAGLRRAGLDTDLGCGRRDLAEDGV